LQEKSLLICPWGEKGAFASDEKNIFKRSVSIKPGLYKKDIFHNKKMFGSF